MSCPPAWATKQEAVPSFSEGFSELGSHPWRFHLQGRPGSSLQGPDFRFLGREPSFIPKALESSYHDNHHVSLTNFTFYFFFFINQSNILSPNTDNRDSLWLTSLHSKKEPASVTLSSKIAYPVFNTPKRLLPTALWSSIFLNSLLRGTLSKACKEVQVNYVPGFTFTYYFINFFKNNMT